MKQLLQLFFSLALLLLLNVACHKDCVPNPVIPPGPTDPPSNSGRISFGNLEVGQKSRYLALLGENYYMKEDTFIYTDDTLQLEIIAKDKNGYLIEETFHYTGDVSTAWLAYQKDSIYRYYVKMVNDTVRFFKIGSIFLPSRIIHYYTNMDGFAMADIGAPKLEMPGWKTNLPYCSCFRTGHLENYKLFGETYQRLNVLLNNSPMATDGDGETYVYSKTNGIVRASKYSLWTQSGYGWDLLP